MKLSIEERLMKDTIKTETCWLFNGCKDSSGYGQIRINGKKKLTHRLSYELYKNNIPIGMLVCHTCDVRNCINPEHLWTGTIEDNNKDRDDKNRGYNRHGENHPRHKLNLKQIEEIRNEDKLIYAKIAIKYGVSRSMIAKIKQNVNWRL